MAQAERLSVLVVDDEIPPREELGYLLAQDGRIAGIRHAGSGAETLQALEQDHVDAVFLDIAMPGLSGLDLARVLARFRKPPAVVFVTAHEEYAVDAFEINAIDYLLKPVSAARVGEAVRRIVDSGRPAEPAPPDETIAVELGGITRFVRRSDVHYVEAHGDYARLHTADESHLVRVPITALELRWREAGFARIHRRYLVSLAHVGQLHNDAGRCTVLVDDVELTVSRRHTRELRDLLVRRAGVAEPS